MSIIQKHVFTLIIFIYIRCLYINDQQYYPTLYQSSFSGITVYYTCNSNHTDRFKHQIDFFQNISVYKNIHPLFTSDLDYNPKGILNILISDDDFSFFYDKLKNGVTPKESLARETSIIAGLYKSMEYFLKETKDKWYLRLDDDNEIYAPNLIKAIEKLESEFSMDKPLLFSQFVRVGHYFFLGGGSGYLFNRKGVQYFIENFDTFLKEKGYHFDIKFHLTLDHFHEKHETAHLSGMTAEFSPRSYYHFKLHYLKDQNKFDNKKWELPLCPPFNFSKEMTPYPVKDIFLYHHYWEMYKYNLTFQMMLNANPPPEVHYYRCRPECRLCWKPITTNKIVLF